MGKDLEVYLLKGHDVIKCFRHACVIVKDLDRALGFYRDMLGFKVVKIVKVEGKFPETILGVKGIKLTYAKMRAPGQPKNAEPAFELHYWQNPVILPKKGRDHISLTVKGLDREYERLHRRGVKFISKPATSPDNETKICFGYDPDGNMIEFMEDL